MSGDGRNAAELRLDSRIAEAGAAPDVTRETYRGLLRGLKARDPDAFARITRHYADTVAPRLAADADPLDAWLDYGRMIGELSAPGRMMAIDGTGRASAITPPIQPGCMVLFLPDEGVRGSFAALLPVHATPAQHATFDLLVAAQLQARG